MEAARRLKARIQAHQITTGVLATDLLWPRLVEFLRLAEIDLSDCRSNGSGAAGRDRHARDHDGHGDRALRPVDGSGCGGADGSCKDEGSDRPDSGCRTAGGKEYVAQAQQETLDAAD